MSPARELRRQAQAAGAVPVADPVVTPWGHHNQRLSAADDLRLTLLRSPS